MRRKLRGAIERIVDFSGAHPYRVLFAALVVLVSSWMYASRLDVRSDVMELLPRDSPGFKAFEHRVQRAGGRATILVLVESPERSANERLIDAIAAKVRGLGGDRVAFVETGTKEVRAFFESNKWLYADVADLKEADDTLDHQIAIQSGMVSDLLDNDEPKPAGEKKHALGMDAFKEKWKKNATDKDDFPSGYFASADGKQIVMRIIATSSGMGASSDDELLRDIQRVVDETKPSSFHPSMKVGYGGDIPNAAAEKESLVREAVVATAIAAALILGGVILFYRSAWALVLVGLPPLLGVGGAYAFATAKYGYVNSSGAFLGAIILGNGVNYPIVLYSRYKEFRARGMSPALARREAVVNAFRAELVGATVASIAYGSLTVTRFRGFSQFGVIGFVGMLLVWISMIACLPALIVVVERMQAHLPEFLREKPAQLGEDESRGPVARFFGDATQRWPLFILGGVLVATALLTPRIPSFLRDPWEYDFDKLGSRGSRNSGAALVSAKSDVILTGRMNLAGSLVLADKPEQVAQVKERILENDRKDPNGALIDDITTVAAFLPGTEKEQAAKLAVLDRMRERLTPGVLARLSEEENESLKDMIPPDRLRALEAKDLPNLLKQRFSERDGTLGTLLYIRYRPNVSTNDGHQLLRISKTIDGVILADGTKVETASRATVFAEMIKSLERDGPLATGVSFVAVVIVVLLATSSKRGAVAVTLSLVLGVFWMVGVAAWTGERLNFLNFIALPITFGIGVEYPFNIFDRSRLLGGDVTRAVKLHLGAVTLCSYTTTIGYGSLLFADNQALQSFGRLAIAGEIGCLLAAVVFLPALLHALGREKSAESSTESPGSPPHAT